VVHRGEHSVALQRADGHRNALGGVEHRTCTTRLTLAGPVSDARVTRAG
jgi:hypothetical protein